MVAVHSSVPVVRSGFIVKREESVQPVNIQWGVYKVQSSSDPDSWYFVNVPKGTCTCIAGVYGFHECKDHCRHYRAARRAAEIIAMAQKPADRPVVLKMNNSLITGIPKGEMTFTITVTDNRLGQDVE